MDFEDKKENKLKYSVHQNEGQKICEYESTDDLCQVCKAQKSEIKGKYKTTDEKVINMLSTCKACADNLIEEESTGKVFVAYSDVLERKSLL